MQTIMPATQLPDITQPLMIDGYTQPGSSPNTNPPGQGDNAVILIELSGAIAATRQQRPQDPGGPMWCARLGDQPVSG